MVPRGCLSDRRESSPRSTSGHHAYAAKKTIDGKGLVLAPGFIDIHTHARRAILEIPTAENYARQGVTTLIEGPDGSSPIPLRAYLEQVQKVKTSVNFGSFIGQGSIRESVIGPNDRKATPGEIEKMLEITRQGMRDGAFGLSTGLFYVPGTFTPTEEVTALAKVAGEMGGIHISHMRQEAQDVVKSVDETIAIGENGLLPTQVTHHKIIGKGNWGASTETLAHVAAARARGVDATIDQYPYTASSTGLNALLPSWAQDGGREATLKRLKDPQTRAKIKAIVVDNIKFDRGGGDPKNIQIASAGFDPTLAGKNLAEITAARGVPVTIENAADTALDIIEKGGASAIFHAISEDDVVKIMRDPNSMVGSDGEVIQFGVAAPASARLRNVRSRPRPLRARTEGHHPPGRDPQDDVVPRATARSVRPRPGAAGDGRGPRALRRERDRRSGHLREAAPVRGRGEVGPGER